MPSSNSLRLSATDTASDPMARDTVRFNPSTRAKNPGDPALSGDSEAGPRKLPPEVRRLIAVGSDDDWRRFLGKYHRLILKTAHQQADTYDEAMDYYAFVLEGLQENEYRRLRRYGADPRGTFPTWLIVVTRRLCEDYRRSRYGRKRPSRGGNGRVSDDHEVRRRLADLVAGPLDPSAIPDRNGRSPEMTLRQAQLIDALRRAIGELSAQDQLILKLRFEDELPGRAIAEVVGLPTPFHAYRRLRAGLARLRHALEAQGVSDAAP